MSNLSRQPVHTEAINALTARLGNPSPSHYYTPIPIYEMAHDKAIEVAIDAIQAGQSAGVAFRLAVSKFKESWPKHTSVELADMERTLRDCLRTEMPFAMIIASKRLAQVIPFVLATSLLLYVCYSWFFMRHRTEYVNYKWVPIDLLPEQFYQVLRLVVFGVGCYGAFQLRRYLGWLWTMIFIAALFNPIVPLRLDPRIWPYVDLITGIVFLFAIPVVWKFSVPLNSKAAT